MIKITQPVFFFLLLVSLTACNDDETAEPEYTVPDTYNFENVSYTGQQSRLAQFSEMKSYMSTSNTQGVALSEERLIAMYNNEPGAEYSQEYTKDLSSKTFPAVQPEFEAQLVALAEASQSQTAGAPGTDGVIVSDNGEKSYLISAEGLDHAQIFEKGLMGACLYYQATSVYMGDDRMNVDNETVTPGEGTEMEHHWDEAFGYFGVPIDFPTSTDGVVFWGDYAVKREAVLGNSQDLMNALLKGRAAISAGDLAARDEAIAEARTEWELISVATALHYLNVGVESFDDTAIMAHGVSEAIGFIYSLQFNEGKKITNSQVSELLTIIAGADRFADMNLYDTTPAHLTQARDMLADIYGLADRKEDF